MDFYSTERSCSSLSISSSLFVKEERGAMNERHQRMQVKKEHHSSLRILLRHYMYYVSSNQQVRSPRFRKGNLGSSAGVCIVGKRQASEAVRFSLHLDTCAVPGGKSTSTTVEEEAITYCHPIPPLSSYLEVGIRRRKSSWHDDAKRREAVRSFLYDDDKMAFAITYKYANCQYNRIRS